MAKKTIQCSVFTVYQIIYWILSVWLLWIVFNNAHKQVVCKLYCQVAESDPNQVSVSMEANQQVNLTDESHQLAVQLCRDVFNVTQHAASQDNGQTQDFTEIITISNLDLLEDMLRLSAAQVLLNLGTLVYLAVGKFWACFRRLDRDPDEPMVSDVKIAHCILPAVRLQTSDDTQTAVQLY